MCFLYRLCDWCNLCLLQAYYFAGLFLLNTERYEKAREYIDRAHRISQLSKDVSWFIAYSYAVRVALSSGSMALTMPSWEYLPSFDVWRVFIPYFLSWWQAIDKVGQLLVRGLVYKENRPMKCTTSKLLTCRVTNGGRTWFAFYVVSQSKDKAT